MRKLSVEQLDLQGKRVFLRTDLNVPLANGGVADDSRLRAALRTIQHCLKAGASVILASHLGRPSGKVDPRYSLAPVAKRLAEFLGQPVPLAPDCVGETTEHRAHALEPGACLLLENLRFYPEEEANDPAFAQALARLADVYVNDAFATCHRAHASIVAVTRYLRPAAAGLLMRRELEVLGQILDRPSRPLVALLGGAKVADKLVLIKHIVARVDSLLIGGAMAFTFLKALGHDPGRSLVEPELVETARKLLAQARARGLQVRLPVDTVVAASPELTQEARTVSIRQIPPALMGLDIGPATLARFQEALRPARTVVWNGPMGVFENPVFARGTVELAKAVAGSGAFTVVGGGDTVAAIHRAGVAEKISYVSTAGGAFLAFLAGSELPGVAALTEDL